MRRVLVLGFEVTYSVIAASSLARIASSNLSDVSSPPKRSMSSQKENGY